jgi:hypothetical protein
MPKENPVQKLEEKFIVNLHGKDFCVYEGILNAAHSKKLKRLEVQILQYPSEENNHESICMATAETSTGEIFTDIGDANPKNVNSKIVPHIIRMSSTRAKSRVLRDMTNIGIATVEELADFDSVIGGGKGKNNLVDIKKKTKPRTNSKSKPAANGNGSGQSKISQAQEKAIMNLSKRRDISPDDLEKMSKEMFNLTIENLSTSDASSFIQSLQKSA